MKKLILFSLNYELVFGRKVLSRKHKRKQIEIDLPNQLIIPMRILWLRFKSRHFLGGNL